MKKLSRTLKKLLRRKAVRRRCKEVLIILIAAVMIVTPIAIFNRLDQTVPKFKGEFQHEAEEYVYRNCHEIANNFIVAEDNRVRGYKRADEKNIDRITEVIEDYQLDDSELLLGWLKEFRNGDYSNAVDFHNYCWKQLGGEVGWAIDLK